MNRYRNLAARVLLAATLGLPLTTTDALAEVSISISSGFPGRHHDHRPRYSHGVPFISRGRSHGHLGTHRGHRSEHRGFRSRILPGRGCAPATQRFYDHYGRRVIRHLTICHDHRGRPYVLGGARGRH